ncbi:hypothetical protein ACFSKU_16485 [Pontibacter silvestris]|uniref:Uncharacterized protein n=1 Tax=Pontibacter silvestris TaxID=2305183 RepID=A0ABW4X3D4_9BACT|nr:hypothetical protein [Pontibacter silvestris]MCC9136070.1 hypothetical protein [Pontibacter silvestris]
MKLFRQIILLTLTLLVLVSSTGVSVGMHLCGGELRDITFLGKPEECPMAQKQEKLPPCHSPKQKDNSCCEDHKLVVERLDVASDTKFINLHSLDIKFIAAVRVVLVQLFAPEPALKPTYALYSSPPLARDIPVLVQSFLL